MAAEGSDTFEPAANKSTAHPMRVILLVEATAAATSSWRGTRKWLDSILQMMEKDTEQQAAAAADLAAKAAAAAGQQQDTKAAAASPASKQAMPRSQYALIVYATHDRSTPAPVQSSGWTSTLKQLFTWLDGVQFVGGVSSKGTALPQALAEAIALSKSPYPGGGHPPAAAAGHPGVVSMSDQEPAAHTHLVVVCPSFNPCRLPLAWPYAADTKAALFSCKHYQSFLECFAKMNVDKSERIMHTLFGQLDFIKGSLVAVTPGTVDIWDLLLSLVRHRLSLSVISSRTQQYRGVLEFFAYGNYCLSSLKAACQRGMVVTSSLHVAVYLSPMFAEAQRAFKPIMQKLLMNAKKKAAQEHQQQHQQQAQQQGQQQAAGQQQRQGQQGQQAPQQQAQQQPPQQQQQQQWQAGNAPRPVVGMQQQPHQQQQQQQQPNAAAAAAAQQQRQAGMQQQQQVQAQQQQARYNSMQMSGASAPTAIAVQQQQQQPPQQQGVAVPVQVAAGQMPGAGGAQAGIVQVQQQPQQPVVMMVQQQPQMMMQQQQQPQVLPGSFMPQQQQAQLLQQQQQMMQQQQQQQAVPMAGVQQQQMAAAAAGGATAAQKAEKQRQRFWRGPVMLHIPEMGIAAPQLLAELELYSSGGGGLSPSWQPRQQVMLQQVVDPAHLQQYMKFSAAQQAAGNKITRVHYRVMQHGPSWHWLQSHLMSRADQQLILLGNITQQLKCLVVFGNQAFKNQGQQPPLNLTEGLFFLTGYGT